MRRVMAVGVILGALSAGAGCATSAPLEAVDPVSARIIRTVLARFTAGGGTVVFSSHVMALVEALCSHVAVIADGRIVASGDLASVRGSAASLDDAFMHLVGADDVRGEDLSWLGSSRA